MASFWSGRRRADRNQHHGCSLPPHIIRLTTALHDLFSLSATLTTLFMLCYPDPLDIHHHRCVLLLFQGLLAFHFMLCRPPRYLSLIVDSSLVPHPASPNLSIPHGMCPHQRAFITASPSQPGLAPCLHPGPLHAFRTLFLSLCFSVTRLSEFFSFSLR